MIERFFALQYGFLFDRSRLLRAVNPALFLVFRKKHWVFFILGVIGSLFNARALMPVMLVLLLDFDMKKADWNFYLLCCAFFIISLIHMLMQLNGIFISTWFK